MNVWANLGFRWKLTIPVLIIALVVAVAAAANYQLMGRIGFHTDRIISDHMPAVEVMLEADRDLYQTLVAERSLIFLGPENPQYQVMRESHGENLAQAEARLLKAFERLHSDAAHAKVQAFRPLFDQWKQTTLRIVEERSNGGRIGRTNAIELTFGPGLEQFEQMRSVLDELVQLSQEAAKAEGVEVQALVAQQHAQQLVAAFLTLVICASVALLFPRVVVRPLNAMRVRFEDMAKGSGDLRVRLGINRRDEIGKIAAAFDLFMSKLQGLIVEIAQLTESLADSSSTLAATSKQSSVRINDQHRSIDLVATAVNEMGATVHEVATHTASAAQETRQAEASAAEGSRVLDRTVNAIRDLAGEVQDTSRVIGELEQETGSIIAILNEIKSIAEQTNLLALNAAIEAARAGEQGRGFAVVADEVRNLAGKTQQSTENINRMVERLKLGVGNAVGAMDANCAKATRAVTQADEAGQAFAAISDAVVQINEMALQIASSAEEQSAVVEDINKNLVEINRVSEESANGAETTLESAEQLRLWADRLRKIVGQFQT